MLHTIQIQLSHPLYPLFFFFFLLPPSNTNLPHNKQYRMYQPGPIPINPSTSSTWIYPLSDKYPERNYQVQMSHSSLLQNTLVSLPTGLGKTLIAAVVMYNYYRWFPEGKIVCKFIISILCIHCICMTWYDVILLMTSPSMLLCLCLCHLYSLRTYTSIGQSAN